MQQDRHPKAAPSLCAPLLVLFLLSFSPVESQYQSCVRQLDHLISLKLDDNNNNHHQHHHKTTEQELTSCTKELENFFNGLLLGNQGAETFGEKEDVRVLCQNKNKKKKRHRDNDKFGSVANNTQSKSNEEMMILSRVCAKTFETLSNQLNITGDAHKACAAHVNNINKLGLAQAGGTLNNQETFVAIIQRIINNNNNSQQSEVTFDRLDSLFHDVYFDFHQEIGGGGGGGLAQDDSSSATTTTTTQTTTTFTTTMFCQRVLVANALLSLQQQQQAQAPTENTANANEHASNNTNTRLKIQKSPPVGLLSPVRAPSPALLQPPPPSLHDHPLKEAQEKRSLAIDYDECFMDLFTSNREWPRDDFINKTELVYFLNSFFGLGIPETRPFEQLEQKYQAAYDTIFLQTGFKIGGFVPGVFLPPLERSNLEFACDELQRAFEGDAPTTPAPTPAPTVPRPTAAPDFRNRCHLGILLNQDNSGTLSKDEYYDILAYLLPDNDTGFGNNFAELPASLKVAFRDYGTTTGTIPIFATAGARSRSVNLFCDRVSNSIYRYQNPDVTDAPSPPPQQSQSTPSPQPPTMTPVQFSLCLESLEDADEAQNDNDVDQDEFVIFLNAVTFNLFAGETFAQLDALFRDVFDSAAGAGVIDISGARDISAASNAEETFLRGFCQDTFDAIFAFNDRTIDITAPPTRSPTDTSVEACFNGLGQADSDDSASLSQSDYLTFVNSIGQNQWSDDAFPQLPYILRFNYDWITGLDEEPSIVAAVSSSALETQKELLIGSCSRTRTVVDSALAGNNNVELLDHCFAGLTLADANGDNVMDRSEFVPFVNFFLGVEYAAAFERLDSEFRRFYNSNIGSDGTINVDGSKPNHNPSEGQKLALDFLCGEFQNTARDVREFSVLLEKCRLSVDAADNGGGVDNTITQNEFVTFIFTMGDLPSRALAFSELSEEIRAFYPTFLASLESVNLVQWVNGLTALTDQQRNSLENSCERAHDLALTLSLPPGNLTTVLSSFVIANDVNLTADNLTLNTSEERQNMAQSYDAFVNEEVAKLVAASASSRLRRRLKAVGVEPGSPALYLLQDAACPQGTQGINTNTTCQTVFARFELVYRDENDVDALNSQTTSTLQQAIADGKLQDQLEQIDPTSLVTIVGAGASTEPRNSTSSSKNDDDDGNSILPIVIAVLGGLGFCCCVACVVLVVGQRRAANSSSSKSDNGSKTSYPGSQDFGFKDEPQQEQAPPVRLPPTPIQEQIIYEEEEIIEEEEYEDEYESEEEEVVSEESKEEMDLFITPADEAQDPPKEKGWGNQNPWESTTSEVGNGFFQQPPTPERSEHSRSSRGSNDDNVQSSPGVVSTDTNEIFGRPVPPAPGSAHSGSSHSRGSQPSVASRESNRTAESKKSARSGINSQFSGAASQKSGGSGGGSRASGGASRGSGSGSGSGSRGSGSGGGGGNLSRTGSANSKGDRSAGSQGASKPLAFAPSAYDSGFNNDTASAFGPPAEFGPSHPASDSEASSAASEESEEVKKIPQSRPISPRTAEQMYGYDEDEESSSDEDSSEEVEEEVIEEEIEEVVEEVVEKEDDDDDDDDEEEEEGSTGQNSIDSEAQRKYRETIEALVREVVPDEIEHVDAMMEQFVGREEELINTLRNMTTSGSDEESSSAESSSEEDSDESSGAPDTPSDVHSANSYDDEDEEEYTDSDNSSYEERTVDS